MLSRYTNFVPHLRGRYLTSNVNITVFNSDGESESVPVGSKFKLRFTFVLSMSFPQTVTPSSLPGSKYCCGFQEGLVHWTCRGRRVTSLGVIFNFTGNDVNTTVQTVASMVKEQWVRHRGALS